MSTKILKGRPIVSGGCRGQALVSTKPLSFLDGVDPNSGIIIEKNYGLKGQRIKDKVICFCYGHGTTVGSYVLYFLVKRGFKNW